MIIFVKPLEGKRCPMPAGPGAPRIQWLPEAGKRVRDSAFWQRRKNEGAVEIITMDVPVSDQEL